VIIKKPQKKTVERLENEFNRYQNFQQQLFDFRMKINDCNPQPQTSDIESESKLNNELISEMDSRISLILHDIKLAFSLLDALNKEIEIELNKV